MLDLNKVFEGLNLESADFTAMRKAVYVGVIATYYKSRSAYCAREELFRKLGWVKQNLLENRSKSIVPVLIYWEDYYLFLVLLNDNSWKLSEGMKNRCRHILELLEPDIFLAE